MSDLDSQSHASSPPPDQTPGLDQVYQDLVGRRVWLPAADATAAAKRVKPLVEREGLDTSDLLKDLLPVRTLVAILTPIS